MEHVKNFNNQSGGEEIANAITHGIGTLLAIAGTAILIVRAAFHSSARTSLLLTNILPSSSKQ